VVSGLEAGSFIIRRGFNGKRFLPLIIRKSIPLMRAGFLAVFFCFLLFPFAFAQQYNFRNLSVKEGVAQSQVYALLQDSRGYLWMGTRGGGLTRYDGMNMKTFTVKDGLVNNYVFCIKEDKQHNLWIGTNNGLSEYNGVQFKNLKPLGDSGQIWVQHIDFDKDGRKWLATNEGVCVLDQEGCVNVTKLLKTPKTVINTLCVDKAGFIWYGNSEGLFKITASNKSYRVEKYGKAQGFMNNSITSIKQDVHGNLWIGTYGDGVYVYNGKQFFRIDQHLELYKQTILDIYFDEAGTVWLATLTHGVAQYDPRTKAIRWLTENEGLSNNHVRSIAQDKSGNYWFGTSGGGVCNYFGKQFTNYDKSSGLGGNFIYSIFRDSKSRLWIGNSEKGVTVLDSLRFTPFDGHNGFQDVKVKAIAEDNQGNIYLGTDGQGVYQYDGTTFRLCEGLRKKYIRAIVIDQEGSLWFATAGTGIYKLSFAGQKQQIENYTVKDGLLSNRLTAMLCDKQGRVWYGTETDGIGYIQKGEVSKKTVLVKDGLPSNSIRCMTEDKSGYLWAGTAGYGIASFPLYAGNFNVQIFDSPNGLTSSNIYLLACDSKDNLFAGSETGLDYVSLNKERKALEIKHYSKGEGFTGIETCQNAVYNDADGSIWFGTINGLCKYNPANLVKNQYEPVTTISDVRLFYESVSKTAFKRFAGDWNSFSELRLPYDQNHLTFDFLGINFSNPDAVKYQWKLKGFDADWSPVSAQRTTTYSNLPAGDYVFLVKACNEDGVWNKTPAMVKFHISSPLWLRPWFIALMILIGLAGVFLIFKQRENRIRSSSLEKQRKLQMEKEIVELEQKALRLQMNPHFIFNALNSIQSQIGSDDGQTARYYLAKFSRLMRQILDNSRNAVITLEEEVSTLENYLLIEKFCNGDQFDYKISVIENLETDYIKIPPMLLQPFVENAIKHGLKFREGFRGMISLDFKLEQNLLKCTITDNGIGRVKSEELNKSGKAGYHQSTALLVTQERLDLLGGKSGIKSLEIIDLYDEQNQAQGTKVIVRIPFE
jgi:ligand-binding sensor domain-containing protein